jgi:hypothetical protein
VVSKFNELRKWKNVNNEKGSRNYERQQILRATDEAKKEYLESICDVIMGFQRTGYDDLMFMKTNNLGWKESHVIRTTNVEDSQGNIKVDQRQILKI